MGLMGMVACGSGFLCLGLWQGAVSVAALMRSRPFRSPPFHAPQLLSIAALALLHFIGGLVASHTDHTLADGVGSAVPLERSSVALVFFVFAVTALVAEKTRFLPLPSEILQFLLLLAFGQEFLLFYLQRADAGLESRYYSLLLVPIGACFVATAIGIAYPFSVLPLLMRSVALISQGTWFFQMGLSFFTTAFIAKGCSLKERGEGDYIISCPGMALMRGKAVATLQFNCQMALLLIVLLPLYGFFTRKDHKLLNYNGLNYERVDTTETYELKTTGQEPFAVSPSSFSLEMDEEETFPNEQHNGNDFQSVAI